MWKQSIANCLKLHAVNSLIVKLVLLNMAIVGLKTNVQVYHEYGHLLDMLDLGTLLILAIEVSVRLLVQGRAFFLKPWNLFDATIIAISLIAFSYEVYYLTPFRALLLIRVIEFSPRMKILVRALLKAFLAILSTVFILAIILYIYAYIGFIHFGASVASYFATFERSFITLFQILAFDDLGNIMAAVTNLHPVMGWIYIISFMFMSAFSFLNLLIGIVVQAISDASAQEEKEATRRHQNLVQDDIKKLKHWLGKIMAHHGIDPNLAHAKPALKAKEPLRKAPPKRPKARK